LKTTSLDKNQKVTLLGSEILEEMRERIAKSFLDVFILLKMSEESKPIGGYDVIGLVHEKFGILMSAGSAYAVLYSLERDGLIKGQLGYRKRGYTLTDKGEKKIKTILKEKAKILGLMLDLFI